MDNFDLHYEIYQLKLELEDLYNKKGTFIDEDIQDKSKELDKLILKLIKRHRD